MDIESRRSLLRWLRTFPSSKTPYPTSFAEWPSFLLGRLYSPLHPFFRDLLLLLRIIRHKGRQKFLLGTIREDTSARNLVQHLFSQGYANHYFAWYDDGELISMRKLQNHSFQYHIRIFSDGEIRAHYERTPEAHPSLHMKEIDMEPRTEEFMALLKDYITPVAKDSK